MRPKILTIQFRLNPDLVAQEQASFQREAGIYADIDFISALDESISWAEPAAVVSSYQGILLGGSGEFDFDGERAPDDPARVGSYALLERLRPLFTYLFEHDMPTLGICFGHQLLGAFAGAAVCCDAAQRKVCVHDIKLMVDRNDYFLLADLPDSFPAHYGHKDSLDRVPEGAILLMNGGDRCKVSALQYKNNIFTTQFHPELNAEDVVDRIKNSPGYLPEGEITEEIRRDTPHANKILQNFSKLVALRATESSKQEMNAYA